MPSITRTLENLHLFGPIIEAIITIPKALEDKLEQKEKRSPIKIMAMIDTGATATVIQQNIIDQLGLNPVGMVKVNTPSSTDHECYQYQVRMLFEPQIVLESVVIGAPLNNQHIQALIGRDILKHGILIYTGYANQFTLSF